MDLAVFALALGIAYFAVQVPLDPNKTKLQRVLGTLLALFGAALVWVLTA